MAENPPQVAAVAVAINSDVLGLRPSQVIRRGGSTASSNSGDAGSKQKKRNNRRGKGKNANAEVSDKAEHFGADVSTEGNRALNNSQQPKARRRRNKKKGKANTSTTTTTEGAATALSTTDEKPPADVPSLTQKSKRKNKNKRRNNNKKHPWRKQVPEGAVDPITLDPIDQLHYPPFALVADEPFEPVPVWPVSATCDGSNNSSNETNAENKTQPKETEEERQRRLIAEQWGHHPKVVSADGETEQIPEKELQKKKPAVPKHKRPYNLYDGRALAYYMVSQLQFIDPLNRRDLTRDELLSLDVYLQRHGFRDLNVTEAYDAKGVTLSTAGAVANTAAGRAAILQEEASGLLHALFGGRNAVARQQPQTNNSNSNRNTLMSLYQAHEHQQQGRRGQRARQPVQEDTGITGGAGFLVIDDSLNPGLRSGAPSFVPSGGSSNNVPNITLYSASHIADRYGHQPLVREHEFPSLAPPPPRAATSKAAPAPIESRRPAAASKTLSKIGSAVRKTDPEEAQRQFEARELARRKAMMSNLTFGSNPASWEQPGIPAQAVATTVEHTTTLGQLERNRAFADALDVAPATSRTNINSGWARPTERPLDEFGNELQTTIYPPQLIEMAREKMDVVLKVEKKWKAFLADDTAASLPLNRMDRPTRLLVHNYSDLWKLHTESFDPEPNRYIHCVKLRDTGAPHPLLSYVVRHGQRAQYSQQTDHPSLQTAGQNTGGREFPPSERASLPLKPRSQAGFVTPSQSLGGAPSRTMDQEETSSRFASLGRERPKLELQKRTLPLEMPPPPEEEQGFDIVEQLARQKQRAEEKMRKEREEAERKQRILEAAFASDDEEGAARSDDDSVWDEPEPLYKGEEE